MFKRSVVLKANKIKHAGSFKPDYKTLIFFTLFLCGLIIGTTVVNKSESEFLTLIMKVLKNNITAKNGGGWLKCFCGDFVWLFIPLFTDFLCGLCGIGLPFIWSIPVVFGCVSGTVFSAFFMSYGVVGLGYCALMYVPCCAITAATLVKCCCESTKMSSEIFFYILGNGKNEGTKKSLLKEYSTVYIVFCIYILIGAAISTCSFKLLSGLFGFI